MALYALRKRLKHLHDTEMLSWREIGSLPEFEGVHFSTLNAIYHGREPKSPTIRAKLGLPAFDTIRQVRASDGTFVSQVKNIAHIYHFDDTGGIHRLMSVDMGQRGFLRVHKVDESDMHVFK